MLLPPSDTSWHTLEVTASVRVDRFIKSNYLVNAPSLVRRSIPAEELVGPNVVSRDVSRLELDLGDHVLQEPNESKDL